MSSFTKYASILLDVAIEKVLDYGVTSEQESLIKRGMRVEVPVRGRLCKGFVYKIKDQADFPKVLPISKLLSDDELISDELFDLAIWMSRYYCAPLRQVFKSILPSTIRGDAKHKQQLFVMRGKTREELRKACEKLRLTNQAQALVLDVMLKVTKGILLTELLELAQVSKSPVTTLANKGLLSLDIVRVDRSPLVNEEYFRTNHKVLNDEQAVALSRISDSLQSHRFESHLLYGVTGSGKTEVYLQAIDETLKLGRGAIMLVPEISLTPQTVDRFRSRFEGHIAILHHRLSAGERYDEWHKIRRGEAGIVIGARSAIFSPLPNLGLIIIDEEHESSYKQTDEAPCYHARDVAVMRGYLSKSAVILGSATPCLESFYNAEKKKYTLSTLSHRADSANLPTVRIVDMKKEYENKKANGSFSDLLLKGIEKRLADGEQTILFLNRRGYHSQQICLTCSEVVKCTQCDLSLTFHYNDNTLSCHLCGYAITPPPHKCPTCNSHSTMKFRGVGTEQIERSLHGIFPEIRTTRMDADTTRHKGSHERLLRDFRTGKSDVLIGTQMIAKGLHFPQVTLVGVLNSDSSLNIPDFRSSERTFQLLTQVAGRAGRGYLPGEVIIQTRMPENDTIALASRQDYPEFYKDEISVREMFGYPPFSHIIKFTFTGKNEKQTLRYGENFQRSFLSKLPPNYEVSPVAPAGYAKIKERYRFQCLGRGPSIYLMNEKIEEVRQKLAPPRDLRLSIDIDPLSTYF